MAELLELIRNIPHSSKIENIKNYNQNDLFLCILQSERFDLLETNSISINISDDESTKRLVDYILSLNDFDNWDVLNYLEKVFTEIQREQIKRYFAENYFQDKTALESFFNNFLHSDEEISNFVKQNKNQFTEFLKQNKYRHEIPYRLLDNSQFIEIILSEKS